MIVRCTGKLLNLLGKRAVTLVEAPPGDDDWYANQLWLDRRKCLLLTNASTLFPILATDIRKRNLQPLGPLPRRRARGCAPPGEPAHRRAWPARPPRDLSRPDRKPARARRHDRDRFQCHWHLESNGCLDEIDTAALNHHLRRTLHHHNGDYHRPLDLVQARLEGS